MRFLAKLPLLAAVLFTITHIFSCKEDDVVPMTPVAPMLDREQHDIETAIETQYSLELVQPLGDIVPSYCCVSLEWMTNFPGPKRVQISADSNFGELLLDTLVNGQNYTYTLSLIPRTTYYWGVEVDTVWRSSTFVTEDVISPFAGIHEVEVTRSCWGGAQGNPYCDSTYYTDIELSVAGNRMVLTNNSLNFHDTIEFMNYLDEHHLLYEKYTEWPLGDSYVLFQLESDSIFGGAGYSLLGGGSNWDFRGVLE